MSTINLHQIFHAHSLNEEVILRLLHQGILNDSYKSRIDGSYTSKIDAQLPAEFGSQVRSDAFASLLWVRLHCEIEAICKVFYPPPPAILQTLNKKLRSIQPGVLNSVIDATKSVSESSAAFAKALSVLWRCVPKQFAAPPFDMLAPALVTDGAGKPIESLIMRAIELALPSNVGFTHMLAEKFPCIPLISGDDGKLAISRVATWWEVFEEVQSQKLEPGCVVYSNGIHSIQLYQHQLVRRDRHTFFEECDGVLGTNAMVYRPRTSEIKQLILSFFEKYKGRRRFLELGFGALLRGNVELLSGPYIFPETGDPLMPDEFTRRWYEMRRIVEPDDVILVRDTKSFLSSAIAKLDGGAWSHALVYLGDGKVSESDTDAQGVLDLDRHYDSRFRIGVYRPYWRKMASPLHGCMSSTLYDFKPKSYAYLPALWCGLQNLLMVKSAPDTPNGIVYSGIYFPVCFV